jgi:hypothetical protein
MMQCSSLRSARSETLFVLLFFEIDAEAMYVCGGLCCHLSRSLCCLHCYTALPVFHKHKKVLKNANILLFFQKLDERWSSVWSAASLPSLGLLLVIVLRFVPFTRYSVPPPHMLFGPKSLLSSLHVFEDLRLRFLRISQFYQSGLMC